MIADGDRLLGAYRDQIDLVVAEAAVERDARVVAERRLIEKERDDALRKQSQLRRAFLALAAEIAGTDSSDPDGTTSS